MAVSLDGLDPTFRQNAENLLDHLQQRGVEMRPCAALRPPQEQAKLWRQSRAREEIATNIQQLRDRGAPFLAGILDSVGPQHGEHVTNALPGFSWHQWGAAIDCFWAVDGRAEWSENTIINGINGYRVYAATARQFNLFAGGNWTRFKDWPHIQNVSDPSPLASGMTYMAIDAAMRERFG